MKSWKGKRLLTTERQIDGIAFIFLVALSLCLLKTAVYSVPSLRTCDVPDMSSESDGAVVLELSGDTEKEGIYYVPAGTSVELFFDMIGFPPHRVFADARRDQTLSGGDRLTVTRDRSGGTVISREKMRVSTALALNEPIDLNSATIGDLVLIQGVGRKTAEAVVGLRKKREGFQRVDEIRGVGGLGEKTYEKIKGHLYIAVK